VVDVVSMERQRDLHTSATAHMAALAWSQEERRRERGVVEWFWFWPAFRPEPLAVNTPPAQRRVVKESVFGASAIRADVVEE